MSTKMVKALYFFYLQFPIILVFASKIRPKLTVNTVANPGEFPGLVSIQVDGSLHTCGGTLIGKRHVLTAAHCIYDFVRAKKELFNVRVVVGRTNLFHGGGKFGVDRIKFHPDYSGSAQFSTFIADIAVIRLTRSIEESDAVKIMRLPEPYEDYPDGTIVTVSGFGAEVFMGPPSPVLKKMNMYTVDHGLCQQLWQGALIGPGHLCAVFGPGYGICQGDSGGSLILNREVVIGVVSAMRGTKCGSGYPDLFTKVSHYMDFINAELALPYPSNSIYKSQV